MLKEVADDKKIGKEIVQAAIKAVKEKGWDVNPYTVADEAKVSRTQLVRDSDLMNLISEAKGGSSSASAPSANPAVAVNETAQAKIKDLEDKLSQLEQEHRGLLEETKRLEDECFDREDRILELEAKCSDLEHEAETLAVQLQNTWNVAYQKGLSDGAIKAREEMLNETGPQKAFSPPVQMQLNDKTQPTQSVAAEAPVAPPQPARTEPVAPPEAAKAEPVPQTQVPQTQEHHDAPTNDAHSHGPQWSRHLDPASKVFNVAKTGPYVASSFNPLDNLSWKDLETVYHFRVSSLKEVTKGLSGEQNPDLASEDASRGVWNAQSQKPVQQAAPVASPQPQKPSSPRDTHPIVPAQEPAAEHRQPKQAYLDFDSPQEESLTNQPPPDTMPAFGAGLHAESALDLDQMDIFEGLEDIEDLGHIDVIEDVQPSSTLYQTTTGDYTPFEGPAYNYKPSPTESLTNLPAMKPPPPTAPELPPDQKQAQAAAPMPDQKQAQAAAPMPEPAQSSSNDSADSLDEKQQAEVLADLIKSRIAQAKEMSMDETPITTTPSTNEGAKPGAPAAGGMKSKFVGGKAAQQAPAGDGAAAPPGSGAAGAAGGKGFTPKVLPPEIKKSLFVLGLRADDLTIAMVNEAWKKQITTPGVHPDQGGDTEYAVHLNTAKDTLIKWLDNQGPKLGKKFGGGGPKKPGS